MKPVNSKSLLAFVFDQMEKLDKSEIDIETAKAQANLAKQSNNLLKYELDRAKTKMQLAQHNANSREESRVVLRDIESKNFD